jgi:hypothetical protein
MRLTDQKRDFRQIKIIDMMMQICFQCRSSLTLCVAGNTNTVRFCGRSESDNTENVPPFKTGKLLTDKHASWLRILQSPHNFH